MGEILKNNPGECVFIAFAIPLCLITLSMVINSIANLMEVRERIRKSKNKTKTF